MHDPIRPSTLRRATVWTVAAVVAACSTATTDLVGGGDVATVSITPSTTTVAIGAQVPLQALVKDPDGKTLGGVPVVWSVQNSTVATISSTGVVTGVALGSTQVAASANGKSGIATITVERTPVASVIVRPSHADASPGSQTPFTAVAYDGAQNPLTGRAFIWTSSNTGVATVDANGVATAAGPGTATITATAEGKSDAATITVSQAAVASVTVTPNPLAMSVGQSTQLNAVLRDAGGNVLSGRSIAWSSSNTGVATVSQQGVLTAVAQGTTTITATSEGKSGTAAVTISNVAVASVAVQPQGPSIVQGGNVQLSATVRDANGTVVSDRVIVWSSSDNSVASVSSAGVVSGVAPGNVTITATCEGKSGTTAVTVTPVPVGSVTVAPPSATIHVTQTVALTATVKDTGGKVVTNHPVTWTSSNSLVASVSSSGVVTGLLPGTATITASADGKSGSSLITVTLIPVGSVTVSPASQGLLATQTFPLVVTVKDSLGAIVTDRIVTWTSSNTGAATVSSLGVVTAVAPGTATITATSETKSGTSAISVTPVPVGIVVVSPPKDSLQPTGTVTLTAITEDSAGGVLTGRTVTWSSSTTGVATVSSTGLVTAVALGTATITATSEGKSGTSAITVQAPVASVAVAPATKTILVTQTAAFTPTIKDAQGNVLTGRTVTWTSRHTNVATVNATTGVATGVAPGTDTVVATSEGKTGIAELIVNPVPVASVAIQPPSPDTVFISYTRQLTATAKDSAGGTLAGRTIAWLSRNTAIATVSATGLVSGLTAGSTRIVATSEGKADSVTLISRAAPVGSVVVAPSVDSVTTSGLADTVRLSATVKDVNGTVVTDRPISWVSTSATNATVSPASGANTLVTGQATGQTKIIATSETKADTSAVSVIQAVTSVTVTPNPASLSLLLNPSRQLTLVLKDGSNATVTGRAITWSSSNTSVATVDSSGVVTAKGLGTATITALDAYDGKSGSTTVNVSP